MLKALTVAAMLCLIATTAISRDVYLVGVREGFPPRFCVSTPRWTSNVLFYNESDSPQTVRLIGVSNGALSTPTHVLLIASRTVVSLEETTGPYWSPSAGTGSIPLWIWHLDVPESVTLSSYVELNEVSCFADLDPIPHGQQTLPSFDSLVPANEKHILLGTDVGLIDRRLNVAVYNAGSVPATAEIAVHQSCDGTTIASELVLIPANTVVHRLRLHSGVIPRECGAQRPRGSYVTVTVDQPSLAFVSALANGEEIRLPHNLISQ